GAEGRLERALIAVLDGLEQGLRGVARGRERLRFRWVGDTRRRVAEHQHGSHDCGDPGPTSGTRRRACYIRRSRHHPFLHFRLGPEASQRWPPPWPPPNPPPWNPPPQP